MSTIKKETCATKTGDYFEEYCHASTIHGFRYFGEKRSICERVTWVIIFAISLSGCIFMILLIYSRYQYSPLIVTFATKETPIYEIPFPAITICPQVKSSFNYRYSKLRAIVDAGNATHQQLHYFEALSMLCETTDKYVRYSNQAHVIKDIPHIFHEIKPHFLNQVFGCTFLGQEINCSHLFLPILTDEGVCYSFNLMNHGEIFTDIVHKFKDYHNTGKYNSSWSLEHGYTDRNNAYAYPRRALMSGASNGLTINLVTLKYDIDLKCRSGDGYKAALHNPMQFPLLKREFIRIPLDESVLVATKPLMITTTKRVRLYPLEKRDCIFPNERKLTYFDYYTPYNCQIECLTDFMLKMCGCVHVYMPRTEDTIICAHDKFKCMNDAEIALHLRELNAQFKAKDGDDSIGSCNCMPICTELNYHIESSETKWHWGNYVTNDLVPLAKHIHMSRLTVYMKVNNFLTSERSELYGWNDFLANFGGLLSLFTGFSFISAVEIIYFLTLRLFCNVRRYGNFPGRVNTEAV